MAILEGNYQHLVGGMQRLSRQHRIPLRAMFELTYRCNFACVHCYNSDAQKASKPSDEVTTAEACDIIDQLREFGCFILGFTGGEIFVRPDAMTIFRHAKRSGFQVIIYTNGYYINEQVADELAELAPNKVDISLHGMSRDVFEEITRRPGSRDRVYRAIDLLVARGVRVGLKSNLFADNREEMPQIRRFADSIGAFHRLSTEFFARNDGSPEPYRYQLAPEEVHAALQALFPQERSDAGNAAPLPRPMPDELVSDTLSSESEPGVKHAPMFTCGVGTTGVVVTPFGEMKPCLEFDRPVFKIAEHTLAGCWERIVCWADEMSHIPEEEWECVACDLRPYCNSCPASRYLATGSVAKCDPYARRKAEFTRRLIEEPALQAAVAGPDDGFRPISNVSSEDCHGGCGTCSKGCS